MHKTIISLVLVVLFFQAYSQKKQPVVKEFSFTDCKNDCKVGIISQKHKGKTLTLVLGVHAHCCMKFDGEILYTNDTLKVNSYKYGHPCRCYCNYELTYVIKGVKKKKLKNIVLFDDWHVDWNTPEKRKAKYEK